jgi:anti-sigma factor RsiW
MQCTQPPELTEEQVNSVLDGVADPAVLRHLEVCPYCSRRVEQARRVDEMLKQRLNRWDCPTPQALRDYHFSLLSAPEEAHIRQHLEDCPHCQAELAELHAFLGQEQALEPQPEPRRPLLSAANLRMLFVPSTPQFAFRGASEPSQPVLYSSSPQPLLFEVEGTSVFLELESTAQGLRLRGQVVTSEGSQETWAQALVELWRGNALQATAVLDEVGGFHCEPVESGQFELRVSAPDGPRLIIDTLEIVDE